MDLERLFRQIVVNLAAQDPGRLRRPLPLGDICNTIVPYRANRRALQIESSEDYELALLRLCAGEGGLAYTEPGQIQLEFASEITSPNPDLAILQRHPEAMVNLSPAAVSKVTDARPDVEFAPPPPFAPQPTAQRSERAPSAQTTGESPTQCTRCSCRLPSGRPINFCPQCGYDLRRRHCGQCSSEVDRDWKHCVNCGAVVATNQFA